MNDTPDSSKDTNTTMNDLIATLSGLSDEPGTELLAEVELAAGRAFGGRRQVREAAQALRSAAEHAQSPALKTGIADEFLALAKSWKGTPEEREGLLRSALKLNPEAAAGPLAQFLQRQGRFSEAEEQWRHAIRLSPHEPGHHLSLARLYKQLGRYQDALAACLDMTLANPSLRTTLVAASFLDDMANSLPEPGPNQAIKVALLGNATLDHLGSYLKVELNRIGLRPQLYIASFDQYTQEILDPESGLYAFGPDLVILAVHASRIFPTLHSFPFDMSADVRRKEMEAGLNQVEALLAALTGRSSALVLVHNMVLPQHPALGPLDLGDEFGQREAFAQINLRLAEMVRTRFKNVHILDEDGIQARYGKERATDTRLWLTSRLPWSDGMMRALASEYLRYVLPLRGLSRKCIVLDLDNTLWGGVIGEDGLAGIAVGSEAPGNAFLAFQRELERLWRRGIMLAISSKNNPDDVLPVFEKHPDMVLKLSHFAAQRINWEPKASQIREIARELNIGLDSLVFLDDNPVERAQVRAELPQVLVPELPADPALYRPAVLELNVFDNLALTEEDRNRNKLYAEQKARGDYESTLEKGNLDEYLAGLEIVVDIVPASDLTLPRIAQLTNKTNQFNLTTRRYSEAQIQEMMARGWLVYGMSVVDRFGSNGLVGVAIAAPAGSNTWEVDTFLLSCRVMGRGVETALLAEIAGQARSRGGRYLTGRYIPTAKNSPVRDFYPKHNFKVAEMHPNGDVVYSYDLQGEEIAVPGWLTVRVAATAW